MIKYAPPQSWIKYDFSAIMEELVTAKSAIRSLRDIPYQRAWVEDLQLIELKREVAGTSRIEGADFTEQELEEAVSETPEQLLTRSQKQAHAAMQTYRWIANIPDDRPLNRDLVLEIHRRMITGADDDHCRPGKIRGPDENVSFGQPRHRGASGGRECKEAFESFVQAVQGEYKEHDPIIQALAAHYHLAAMHPFLDGNGRTARALEALLLQRAGLRDTCFIAMSNYYYDEKTAYLASLAKAGSDRHDLTQFLAYGLRGIALQSQRLLREIRVHVQKALFRNLMYDLFTRLKTPRRRVIAERQLEILKLLLDEGPMELDQLYNRNAIHYQKLKHPVNAFIRDIFGLREIQSVRIEKISGNQYEISPCLEWPTKITETDFLDRMKSLPKAKTFPFTL